MACSKDSVLIADINLWEASHINKLPAPRGQQLYTWHQAMFGSVFWSVIHWRSFHYIYKPQDTRM